MTCSMRPAAIAQIAHGLVGARELADGAGGGGARLIDLTAGIDGQSLHVARGGGDIGDIIGRLRRGVGRIPHLLRHQTVGLRQLGGGAANAFAGLGKGIDHIVDRAPEIAGEKMLAGVMQPRLGFAPDLVNRQRIGLEQRRADDAGGIAEILDGAIAHQFRKAGVTVAAGDGRDRGNDPGEPAFGKAADRQRAERGEANRQRDRRHKIKNPGDGNADAENRRRNPQRGTRQSKAAWGGHCSLKTEEITSARFAEGSFQILFASAKSPHEIRANAHKD